VSLDETIAIRKGEEIDGERVARYLRRHVEGLPETPIEIRQFPSGASNLTYLIRIGEWEAILRRAPLGPVPPKAHDMKREAGLLRAIHPVFPLAPMPLVFCDDVDVLGAHFYVMERRRGVILDTSLPSNPEFGPEVWRATSESLVRSLAQIHAVDWKGVGLDSFGHAEGFLLRQVGSWIERYKRSQTEDVPALARLVSWLNERVPDSPAATLIHNDFKLNNVMLREHDLTVPVAVLDWEMATIGDPLFDLAVFLSYWVRSDDPPEIQSVLPAVTMAPGFLDRNEITGLYARLTGRDLGGMHYYLVFAYFKLAVILQQIYVRWKRGQTRDARFAVFGERADILIAYAAEVAGIGR
jgi:aminoglycoside phosphotransferase (APT) family kinase protein